MEKYPYLQYSFKCNQHRQAVCDIIIQQGKHPWPHSFSRSCSFFQAQNVCAVAGLVRFGALPVPDEHINSAPIHGPEPASSI